MGAPKAPKKIFLEGVLKEWSRIKYCLPSGGPSKSFPTKFMLNKGGVCEA